MGLTTKHLSLSALNPIQLTYRQFPTSETEESFNVKPQIYKEGIRTFKHEALIDVRDAAFSKKTVLVLTSIKDLKDVFSETLTNSENLIIAGSCRLLIEDAPILNGDVAIREYNDELFVGGKGDVVDFTITPIEGKWVELKAGSKYLEVSDTYPYAVNLVSTKTLSKESYYFQIDFYENLIGLKKQTAEGFRFLSYGADRKFRCNGLQLNRTIVNPYLFDTIFYNTPTFLYGYDPTNFEIKYYNTIEGGKQTKSLDVKEKAQHDTNLLISMALSELANKKASANISLLKTNFSATGNYSTSI